MTWMDVLINVINSLVNIVVTLAIPYLFVLIKKKLSNDEKLANNDKVKYYMNLAQDYLCDTVIMVKQTFVDSLKAEGKFDANAQAEAFSIAKETWLDMMSEEMKDIIINEVGDLDLWVNAKLEKYVVETKPS